jgi:hypothetical protein
MKIVRVECECLMSVTLQNYIVILPVGAQIFCFEPVA